MIARLQSLSGECATVFVIGLTMRVSMAMALGAFHGAPGGEMFNVAQSIISKGEFGNPNGVPSGPTAHVAPLYPYLLAALLKVTSNTDSISRLLTILSMLAASLLWGLLPLVADRLELPRRVGLLGGLIGATNPLRHWVELIGYWDTVASGICLMGLVAFTFSRRSHWTTPIQSSILGVGWGILCLLQPAAIVAFGVVMGVLLREPVAWLTRVRATSVVLLALVLTLTPWTVRNYNTFGGLMFVRSNLGVELSASNNDGALPSRENTLLNPLARHPHVSQVEFNLRNEMGELRYSQRRRNEAFRWITANPARFASLSMSRARLFWVPDRSFRALTSLELMLTALAVVGLISLMKTRAASRWLVFGLWVLYPLLYYIVQADERYRYPIEWSIVLAAAAGLLHLGDLFGASRRLFAR